MEIARIGIDWLALVAEGKAPMLSEDDRRHVVDVVLTLRGEVSRLGITRGDGTDMRIRARQAAHALVNALARANSLDAPNPFAATGFESMYGTAKHRKEYMLSTGRRPTLQLLLNKRADLIAEVYARAAHMEEELAREARVFGLMLQDHLVHSQTHKVACDGLQEATKAFQQSLCELRQFRNAPTTDSSLLQIYHEMKALELSVSTIEQCVRLSQTAGSETDIAEQRNLRHAQLALRAFLIKHGATMPLSVSHSPSPRVSLGQ
jgi:hypothetical protein